MSRYFESIFPVNGNVILGSVINLDETGAFVSLIEYDNIQGMLMLSEISRRRIRSFNKLIKIGKIEVLLTIRVDLQKGYIDLSKRKISDEEIELMEKKKSFLKYVNSIFFTLGRKVNINQEDFRVRYHWPSSRKLESYIGVLIDTEKNALLYSGDLDTNRYEMNRIHSIVAKKIKTACPHLEIFFDLVTITGNGFPMVQKCLSDLNKLEKCYNFKLTVISIPTFKLKFFTQNKKRALKDAIEILKKINNCLDLTYMNLKITKIVN